MAPLFSFFFMATQLLLFLHISPSWVKIRLYTENQLPNLFGSGLKKIKFFFDGIPFFLVHISSTWVKIRLYTKSQLPRLYGSGLKVCGGVVGWWVTHQLPCNTNFVFG
jgi:hypothetical protein